MKNYAGENTIFKGYGALLKMVSLMPTQRTTKFHVLLLNNAL